MPSLKTARWLKGISQLTAAFLVAAGLVVSPVQSPNANANQSTGANSENDYSLALTGAGGDGSYLKTAHHSDFNRGGNSSQLIEAWVKPSAVSSQNVVFAKDLSYVVRASANGWILLTGSGSGWGSEAVGGTVKIGVWQHVALVVEQSQQRLYIDGNLVATVNNAHGDNTRAFSVGAYEDGNAPFAGEIDEVKIWVNKNQNDIPVTMSTRASATDGNLRSYWDFNEDSGTTVYNRKSGSVQNLELQGVGTRTDVKTVSSLAPNDRVVTFPRSYLPGNGVWTVPEGVTSAQVLVVAGGGAGGAGIGGGGGAGEVLYSSNYSVSGSYSVVVGHGGVASYGAGGRGANSAFGSLEAYGGGGGGKDSSSQTTPAQPANGNSYGSGGGAGFDHNALTTNSRTLSGVNRYASSGGNGSNGSGGEAAGGGGGGAGGNGANGIRSSVLTVGGNQTTLYGFGGSGGSGFTSSITGSSVSYGCGGGGGINGVYSWSTGYPGSGGCNSAGNGGLGDSTNDGVANHTSGFPAAANSGSGGGGASNAAQGGAGGSGLVVVRYTLPSSPTPSFGTVTRTTGGFTFPITNFLTGGNDSNFAWAVSSSVGSASLDSQGIVTVTGLASEATATITVNVSRSGYVSASNTVTGTSLVVYQPCVPAVSNAIPGFTVLTFANTGICEWDAPAGVSEVDLLVVGGGGGAGTPDWRDYRGGSGGAGGVFKASGVAIPTSVVIEVGSGGTAQQDGSKSAFGTLLVGGGGLGPDPYTSYYPGNGGGGGSYVSGGNGGGGNHNVPGYFTRTSAGTGGTVGTVTFNGASFTGFAGAPGTNGGSDYSMPGIGGQIALSDRTSDITGSSLAYAAGGTNLATSAPQTYGSGGHSRSGWTSGVQGVVIVRYANDACTPAVNTYVGDGTNGILNTNYRTYTFNPGSSCPWTVPSGISEVEALLVGGGGGGGAAFDSGGAGGGGGGQVVVTDIDLTGVSTVTVQVGAGGAGGVGSAGATRETNGSPGGNSTIFISGATLASALGGEGGARSRGDYLSPARAVGTGGAPATANTPARGGAMGGNSQSATWGMGGGGGGSSGAGGNGQSNTTVSALGGAGTISYISGSSQTFGRGGAGSPYWANPANGLSASGSTGNGGGGARASTTGADQKSGGAGGSGLIILRAEVAPANYTVNFDANTGTGTMASRTEANNVAFTLPANSFEKSGFTFQGWNTKADGTGTSYEAGDSVTLTGTSTVVTFYPEWRAVLSIATPSTGLSATFDESYNLSVVASGGSGGYTYSVASGSLPSGLSLNASTGVISGTPTAAGSLAIQVSVQDSESTSVTTSSFTITVSAAAVGAVSTPTASAPAGVAKRINVSWSAVANADFYTIKVYNQAGTTLLSTTSSVVGTSTSITTSNFASIADNTSYAITVSATASGNYADGAESSSVVAKTNFVRTVTYQFNNADGGASPASANFVEGGTALTLPTPTRTGYNFAGWFEEAGLSTSAGAAGASYTPSATLTLHAKWDAIACSISSNTTDSPGYVVLKITSTSACVWKNTYGKTSFDLALVGGGGAGGWGSRGAGGGAGQLIESKNSLSLAADTELVIKVGPGGAAPGDTGGGGNGFETYIISGADRLVSALGGGGGGGSATPNGQSGGSGGGGIGDGNGGARLGGLGSSVVPASPSTFDVSLWSAYGNGGAGRAINTVGAGGGGGGAGASGSDSGAGGLGRSLWGSETLKVAGGGQGVFYSSRVNAAYAFGGGHSVTSSGAYACDVNFPCVGISGTGGGGGARHNGGSGAVFFRYASTFTITFDDDGAETGSPSVSSMSYTSQASAPVLATVGTMVKSGYDFVGWSLTQGGNKLSAAWKPTSDLTLYPVWKAQQHTITFKANYSGGPSDAVQTVDADDPTPLSANSFARAGYSFAGWHTNANGTGGDDYADSASVSLDVDLVLWAKWTANTYTVTFDYNNANGGTRPATLPYTSGSTAITLPTPSRTGYTLAGWFEDSGFTSAAGDPGDTFTTTADLTLYARWNANTYTLTFDSNGGSAVNALSFLADSAVAIPTQPTRAGFRFVGWSTSEAADQGDLANRVFTWPYTPGIASRTLYAAWADDYSLTLAGNSAVSARIGSSAGPELNVVPKESSFTWEGWIRPTNAGREWSSIFDNLNPVNGGRAALFIRDTGTGPLLNSFYRSDSGNQSAVQSSVNSIRYNQWQHIAISYTRTGAAEGSCVGTGALETRIYIDGVLVRSFSDPSFTGCLVNRGLTVGNVGTNQQFNGSIDQVKIWDGALSQAEIQSSMSSFGVGAVDNNLRAHYSFDDLAASPAAGQKLKNLASNEGSSDLVLFAATASNVAANTSRTLNSFDISFDGNEELSGSVATISGTRPFSSQTLPTKGTLLRPGYTFTDWDTVSAGGGTSYSESASYVTLYGDRTFFAQWEANGLAVTWNPKGGSAVTGTTVATNAQLTAPTAPTRTGYTFAGWSATDGGAAVSFPYTHGQTDAFTMFALWTANTLTLSFDSNGGSAVTAISFLADATASRPTSPSKPGFRFAGWSTSETSDQGDLAQRVLTWPYSPGVSDRTLYAIWVDDYSLGLAGNARVSARVGTSASPVSVVPNNSSYTWEAWIYPTGVSGTGATKYSTILDNLDDGNNYGRSWFYLIDGAGGPRIQVGYYAAGTPEEGTSVATNGNTIRYNQWQHVAVSIERTGGAAGSCVGTGVLTIRIYIDGVLSATGQDSSFSRCLASLGLGIGDNWDDPNQQFKGRIDQVKVWDGALSQAQIQNSRQSFGAGTVVNNLRAHYSFDDLGSSPASANAVDNLVTHNGEFDLTLFAATPADVAANTSRQLNSFDLTFDENGADSGSVATISGTRPYVTSTIAAQGDLLKAGYTFAGWDTSANGSGTSYAAGDSYLALYGSQTFYAQWDADDLAVTWDAKGGTTIASTTVKTNATLAAPANPTRTGYTFDGWSATDGGSKVTFPYTHGKTAGFTMFARWIADVYTVTYNYNSSDGGESRATDTFTVGTTALTLPVPTRTGYGFGGWFVSPTFAGQAVSSTYTPTASVTLNAKWTGQTYTILYEYNGADGNAATDSDSYTSGLTAITPPTPTKTGHTFGGWFESPTFAGSPVGASYTTSQNRTLYAKWTAIQYSVTYNPDIVVSGVTYSGSGDVPTAGSSYTIGQSVPVLPNAQATPLTRLGYTFLGWVTNADGTGAALNSGDSVTMGSANINFYPKWSANTYSITYNLNGGTGSLSGAPTSYTVGGNSVSLPSSGFTKTGFNFLGWTKVQGGTTPISNTFSTFTDVTLTAIWELKTITYTFDDGIANSANIQNWPSNSSASFGSSITLPNLTGVTTTVGSDSYLFFGWEYQGSTYESGDTFTLGEAAPTFTAQWIQLFDVRYGFAGGTHSVAGDQDAACLANNPQLCTNAQVITLRSNPSRPGYTFEGWKVQAKATVKAGGAQHTLRNDEYLFYAQWQAIDYTFSFNSVGGSNNFADVTKNIGQVITLPNPGQKPGHSFAGWSANGSQSLLSASAPFVVSTASVSFDAVWIADVYTVVFDWQGALGAPQPNASYTFGSGNMTFPVVGGRTKDGFNFAGWSTAPSGSVLTDFQPTSDDVLYAIWTDGSYALTFAPKGGAMANTTASVPRGNSIQMPNPVREGFVFTGWFDQASGGTLVAAGGATFSPIASRTLHARWVQRSLFGVDLAALETSQEYTASSVNDIDTTISHNPTGTSARIQIPAGSLPSGTKVNVRFFKDTERQEQVISNQNSYIFSVLISWMLGSGDSATVPNTDPDKPLVVTLNNSDIKAGAMIYMVVGDQITELGRATQNGTVTVELYEDPEVVVALTPPSVPASMLVTAGDTQATVAWTAPLADGGLPTTSYTVTASPGGQTCTWTSGPLTCTITGLTNGLSYTFSVVANNRLGSSIAASNSATPTQPASNNAGSLGPTGPAAGIKPVTGQTKIWTKRISANQVKVYIKFPEMGSNYQIKLQKNTGDFRRVMSKTIDTTSDTSLRVVGNWYYLVRTLDLPGEGRYRIEVSVDGERMLLNGNDRPAVFRYK